MVGGRGMPEEEEQLPRESLKFGFGRDVPPWNLKVDPYKSIQHTK